MGKKNDNIVYEDGCPDWMMTMGDSMSLLVTFFVLLISFSTPDDQKMLNVLGGIKGALSMMSVGIKKPDMQLFEDKENAAGGKITGGGQKEILVKKESLAVVNLKTLKVKNLYNEFKDRIMDLGFKNYVTTRQLDEGIYIEIPFDKLFIKGKTQLDYMAPRLLEGFANLVNSVGNELQLTACFRLGTTSSGSNTSWSLNRRRLYAVSELLNVRYKIPWRRMSLGYKVISEKKPSYLSLLLAEKIGINEVDITELINQSQSDNL
jgi:chemotaxis protein MotB